MPIHRPVNLTSYFLHKSGSVWTKRGLAVEKSHLFRQRGEPGVRYPHTYLIMPASAEHLLHTCDTTLTEVEVNFWPSVLAQTLSLGCTPAGRVDSVACWKRRIAVTKPDRNSRLGRFNLGRIDLSREDNKETTSYGKVGELLSRNFRGPTETSSPGWLS